MYSGLSRCCMAIEGPEAPEIKKYNSIGSSLDWYHEGRGFESRQGKGNISEFELICYINK